MKSSKDLVSHHLNKDRYFVPAPPSHHQPKTVADSVYVTTTRASPLKTNESPTKTQRLNPESSTRKRQSYVNTPAAPIPAHPPGTAAAAKDLSPLGVAPQARGAKVAGTERDA